MSARSKPAIDVRLAAAAAERNLIRRSIALDRIALELIKAADRKARAQKPRPKPQDMEPPVPPRSKWVPLGLRNALRSNNKKVRS